MISVSRFAQPHQYMKYVGFRGKYSQQSEYYDDDKIDENGTIN